MNKAGRMYHRYGYWSLLISWMPVIGDPITLIAGLMRENFLRFLMMVSIAKNGALSIFVLGDNGFVLAEAN